MSKIAPIVSSTLLFCVLASPARSQDRWELDLRGGAAFPTVDAGSLPLDGT